MTGRQRRASTGLLVWLAFMLPLLALLALQFDLGCEGDCSGTQSVVALVAVPLLLGWVVVLALLLIRLVSRLSRD